MRLILSFLVAVAAFGQAPAGLEPSWEMAAVIDQIGKDCARLIPVLGQMNAAGWVQRGASETYLAQLESSKEQARAIALEAGTLSHNPEKLSIGLQLYFRFQALETMLQSLEDGSRKYQSAQLSQTLAAAFAEGGANRERFRNYLVALAADRERQYEVMDQETQRCRALLMSAPSRNTVKKK